MMNFKKKQTSWDKTSSKISPRKASDEEPHNNNNEGNL